MSKAKSGGKEPRAGAAPKKGAKHGQLQDALAVAPATPLSTTTMAQWVLRHMAGAEHGIIGGGASVPWQPMSEQLDHAHVYNVSPAGPPFGSKPP